MCSIKHNCCAASFKKMFNIVAAGQKVYFPNFVFTLLRTDRHTKNQVAFKCSTILTKFDIHQYLTKLYGLKILDVRTFTYPMKKRRSGHVIETEAAWKKVYVTLDHDFTFPEYKPPNMELPS